VRHLRREREDGWEALPLFVRFCIPLHHSSATPTYLVHSTDMEFQPSVVYLPFTELNFQHLVSYQYPADEAAPAPATDPWMDIVFNRFDWTADLPADPRIGPAAPYSAETLQVLQTPIPYILPDPLWSLSRLSTGECS